MDFIKGASLAALLILAGCDQQGDAQNGADVPGYSKCGLAIELEATAPDGTKLWHDPCQYDVYFASSGTDHEWRSGKSTHHMHVGTSQ